MIDFIDMEEHENSFRSHPVHPRSGKRNRAGFVLRLSHRLPRFWSRIWDKRAPKGLHFGPNCPLYSVENKGTPGLNRRLLTDELWRKKLTLVLQINDERGARRRSWHRLLVQKEQAGRGRHV